MKNYTAMALQGQTLFMGIDVHKKSWTVTVRTFETVQGTIKVKGLNDLLEILNAVPLAAWRVVYEAGFSGFWLQRELEKRNIDCMVTSPALAPVRVGSKVKTDKIDSQRLAECLAAGQLRAIYVPSEIEEAQRELIRQREQFIQDSARAKNRIKSFLLLHNVNFDPSGNGVWSKAYYEGLKTLDLGFPELNRTLQRYIQMLEEVRIMVAELTLEIAKLASSKDFCK